MMKCKVLSGGYLYVDIWENDKEVPEDTAVQAKERHRTCGLVVTVC